ncbi:hypothetical protein LCGC14_2740680, partial [marine sediment metagenome]
MAYKRDRLREEVYLRLGEKTQRDKLGAALGDTTTLTFQSTDYTKYSDNALVEFGTGELAFVNGKPSSDTGGADVQPTLHARGERGTTAAIQPISTKILINPKILQRDINSDFNDCLVNRVLKEVDDDDAITIAADTRLYDLPSAINANRIISIWIKSSNEKDRSVIR